MRHDGGLGVVGGVPAVFTALQVAIEMSRAIILQVVLAVEVQRGINATNWVRGRFAGFPVLHFAVGFGSLSTTRVLLAAGADETVVTRDGGLAMDIIG